MKMEKLNAPLGPTPREGNIKKEYAQKHLWYFILNIFKCLTQIIQTRWISYIRYRFSSVNLILIDRANF